MQQTKDLRSRVLGDSGWFRIGLISTTLAAPLLARWRELRSQYERASAYDVGTPLANARRLVARAQAMRVAQVLPLRNADVVAVEEREKPDPRLWLIGVGVGLVATGAVAYFVARQRLSQRAEDLLELPLQQATSAGSAGGAATTSTANMTASRNGHASPLRSTSGATMTMTPGVGAPTVSPTEGTQSAYEPAAAVEPGMPEPEPNIPAAGTANPKTARFVGNIHTMIFHDIVDDSHLPAEENRVYFANEEEARESGFRRDRDEVPPGASPTFQER